MSFKIPGRAHSPEEKKVVLDRLYAVWIANPNMRLGQMMINAFDDEDDLFYAEDEELIAELETFVTKG